MKLLICFISIVFFSLRAVSQQINNGSIQRAVYKITIKEKKLYGYLRILNDSNFIYFGTSSLDFSGSGYDNFISYQEGKWRIKEKRNFQTWGEKPIKGAYIATDSLMYNASNKFNSDSCYFKISIHDRSNSPIREVLLSFKDYENRLFPLVNSEEKVFQFKKIHKNSSIQITEPFWHYPTTNIMIDSSYNYHEIKVYLKKFPEKMGLILEHFKPIGFNSKIKFDKDKILLDNYFVLSPAAPNEFKTYLQEVIKANPYYKSYLEDIRTKFYP